MSQRTRLIEAAAWVIRQDGRLLGLPEIRNRLINLAVLIGTDGIEMPSEAGLRFTHPENRPAVLDALGRAAAAVRAAATPPRLSEI